MSSVPGNQEYSQLLRPINTVDGVTRNQLDAWIDSHSRDVPVTSESVQKAKDAIEQLLNKLKEQKVCSDWTGRELTQAEKDEIHTKGDILLTNLSDLTF